MPCYDSRDHDNSELYDKIELLTRVSCDLARALRATATAGQFLDVSQETLDWIRQHDLEDKRHAEEKQRAASREEAQRRALAKLTPDERRLLGLAKA